MRFLRFSFLALVFVAPAFRVLAAEPILKIVSPEKTLTFTAAEFATLPQTELKVTDPHDARKRTYAGVSMRELLTRVGAPLGGKLRGPALMTGVIVRCKDSYAVFFSLAEFDENFSTRTILLADQEDGQMLPPSAAPLRIVTPGDKRGARSARQVTSIEIVSLTKP
ncbi:MAG: molybdopterin-dependent oxidoreductase [Opitutaceae bacterium]